MTSGRPGRNQVLIGSLVLVASSYLAVLLIYGRFAHTDEVFFKAAGLQWALQGRFAAPELHGFLGLHPPLETVFLPQPPIYSFLFGLFVKAFGFGWRTCIAYDALIHLALVAVAYVLALRMSSRVDVAAVVGLAVLPQGTMSRPDELAMCFGSLAILAVMDHPLTRRRAAAMGLFLGVAAGTSAGVAVLLGLVAAVKVLATDIPLRRKVTCLGISLVVAAMALVAILAPILAFHPDAYQQYLGLAADQVGRGGWGAGFQFAWRYGRGVMLMEACCLLVGTMALVTGAQRASAWMAVWLAPLAGMAFIAVALPSKYTYLWFLGPWLIACALSSLVLLGARRWRPLGAALIVAGIAVGSINYLGQMAIVLILPADQRIGVNHERVRSLVPPGTAVLALEDWWSLGADHQVFDSYFSQPNGIVDYVVLTGNGSGTPGKPQALNPNLERLVAEEFVVLDDHLNREPLSLFGFRLTNSAYGFGSLVFQSRRLAGRAGPSR